MLLEFQPLLKDVDYDQSQFEVHCQLEYGLRILSAPSLEVPLKTAALCPANNLLDFEFVGMS